MKTIFISIAINDIFSIIIDKEFIRVTSEGDKNKFITIKDAIMLNPLS